MWCYPFIACERYLGTHVGLVKALRVGVKAELLCINGAYELEIVNVKWNVKIVSTVQPGIPYNFELNLPASLST